MTSSQLKNELIAARSAYLRSAAAQPIHWQEWSDAAFERARQANKPILLDIGAVWCHWCHVMDGESYENEEIARIINEHFIAIKVDRDERPDIDSRMQIAVQAISGQGGWPLIAFLTPEAKPFFAGTYFPPEDRYGRPGFRSVLTNIAAYYQKNPKEIVEQSEKVSEAICAVDAVAPPEPSLSAGLLEEMLNSIAQAFDIRNGGFGDAPKFPHAAAVDLLLHHAGQAREPWPLTIAETTLTKMARGGVYDQIGGGFHRYSTDAHWTVPHFEKMSYDNSELLKNYLHAYQTTRHPLYRDTARGMIAWVNTVLSDQREGGFFASQDADIDMHDDGDYFTWTLDELAAALSPDTTPVMRLYYGVEATGDMHHNPQKNVLEVSATPNEIAKRLNLSEERVRELIAAGRQQLLAARAKRNAPFVDRTLYTAWNAMMISAFLEAERILGIRPCGEFALKSLDRLIALAYEEEEGMLHSIVDGEARVSGLIEDQIQMAQALLDAYESTLQKKYFDLAERLMKRALDQFWDVEQGGFFDVPRNRRAIGALAACRKPFQDSPTPAANSVAAIVLLRLFHFTENPLYRERAESILKLFSGAASRYGLYAATYGLALSLYLRQPEQVLIVAPKGSQAADAFFEKAMQSYRLGRVVLRLSPDEVSAERLAPALYSMAKDLPLDSTPRAFVCREFTCSPPVNSPDTLAEILSSPAAK